jgi:hypothetical protein
VKESSESSRSKADESERPEHFEDIVEWARSNGWTDFDFEGLERRVVELAALMRQASPESVSSSASKDSKKLVRFVRKLPPRGRSDG